MSDPTAIDLQRDPTTQRFSGVAVHGNVPFDVPYVSEIADDLWLGGCTTGLILPRWVDHVVSLYPWEQYKTKHELQSVLSVRLYDSIDGIEPAQVRAIAEWVNVCRKNGTVLVHCQAGLNRSSLIVATALHLGGMNAPDAIALLRERRSPAVLCNPTFEEQVMALDDPE